MMRYYKHIMMGWLVVFGIFFVMRFIGNDETKIKKVFTSIRLEFAEVEPNNLMETATSILKILSSFSADYSGVMENIKIDSENGLREGVAYLVQSFSPVNSELKFNRIGINKDAADVLLDVQILNSRSPGILKDQYSFEIKMIKKNGKWLIQSSRQI